MVLAGDTDARARHRPSARRTAVTPSVTRAVTRALRKPRCRRVVTQLLALFGARAPGTSVAGWRPAVPSPTPGAHAVTPRPARGEPRRVHPHRRIARARCAGRLP